MPTSIAPNDRNMNDSAFVENRGPSTTTTVPWSWKLHPCFRVDSIKIYSKHDHPALQHSNSSIDHSINQSNNSQLLHNHDKKSELMLMRHTRAYSISCSQVILVYLYPFRRNSLSCSQNRQKSLKTNIFKIQGHLRSSMLTFLRSSSLVLVMISSMSVHICNYFHARQANNG